MFKEDALRQLIPAPVISVLADISSSCETHATLDSLFMYASAPGDPPEGSKYVKALEWLRRVNKDTTIDPLKMCGKFIESYMETPLKDGDPGTDRKKIVDVLAQVNLQYVIGGEIRSTSSSLTVATKTLETMLSSFDYTAVNEEFSRALLNVEKEPREAVSAASNIIESLCKVLARTQI